MRDAEAPELDRVWTTADLAELPRGQTYWNPFAVLIMAGNPRAEKLGRKWVELHDGYQDGPPPNPDHSDDPLATILADAAMRRAGVHIVKNHETGDVGVFPRRKDHYTRDEELAWETRARAMHEAQQTVDPDLLTERPRETLGEKMQRRQTFHEHWSDPVEPPRFDDLSPEERARWNKLTRGD